MFHSDFHFQPISPLFPILSPFDDAWDRDFFFPPHRSLFTPEEREFFRSCSNWNSHVAAPIDSETPSRLQKTTLKIHDAEIIWKANVGSPAEISRSLDRLENAEKYGWNRAEMIDGIQAAKPIVAQAVATFEKIVDYERELVQRRNELRTKEKSAEVNGQLMIVSEQLKLIRTLDLPKELTKDSVEEYTSKANQTLDRFKAQLNLHPEQPEAPQRSDVAKTHAKGIAFKNAIKKVRELCASVSQVSKKVHQEIIGLEVLTDQFKDHSELLSRLKEQSTKLEKLLKETPTDKSDRAAIEAYAAAADALCSSTQELIKQLQTDKEAITAKQVIAEKVAAEDAETDSLKKKLNSRIDALEKSFDKLIEDLEGDHPQIEEDLQDLQQIHEEELDILVEDVLYAPSCEELNTSEKLIHAYEAIFKIILDQIRGTATQARKQSNEIGDCFHHAKCLMKKLDGITQEETRKATQDAIDILLDADKRGNDRDVNKLTKFRDFFQPRGFSELSFSLSHAILQFKYAQMLFNKGDSIDKLDLYANKWNDTEVIVEKNGLRNLDPLRKSEADKEKVLKKASEQIDKWKKECQFALIDYLNELLKEDPAISQKATLTQKQAPKYIKANADFCAKIEEFLENAIEMPLVDVVAAYEDSEPETAAAARKLLLSQLQFDINELEHRIESSPSIAPKDDAHRVALRETLKKFGEQVKELRSLMTSFEISTGFFGLSKEKVSPETLSSANLKKFEAVVKEKMAACKKECTRILAEAQT